MKLFSPVLNCGLYIELDYCNLVSDQVTYKAIESGGGSSMDVGLS